MLVAVQALDGMDRAILEAAQTLQSPWLDRVASLFTFLGRSEVIGVVVLGVAIARLRARRRDWWVPLLIVAVVAVELVAKVFIVQDPPPDEISRIARLAPFPEDPTLYVFPSGHVARTAFLVTALRWPWAATTLTVLVMALTRVYLAAHWPSDVIAGWLLGYGVAAIARRT